MTDFFFFFFEETIPEKEVSQASQVLVVPYNAPMQGFLTIVDL